MAGYLDQYGAGEERREKIIKTVVISLVALVVLGGIGFFVFHNYRQERQVKRFFEYLAGPRLSGARMRCGCTTRATVPRLSRSTEFMEDWGPQSGHRDVSKYRITRSRSCGSGVILTVDFGKNQQEKLWVQRDDLTIGFSPLPGCPAPR